jgi:hypothetical protein
MDNNMSKNTKWPLGELIIDGRKQYSRKSLKYKGIVELCACDTWWPLGHLH